jgi:hypothetical protein
MYISRCIACEQWNEWLLLVTVPLLLDEYDNVTEKPWVRCMKRTASKRKDTSM